MPARQDSSRRHFLHVLGATAAVTVMACHKDGGGASEATGDIPAGNVSALSVGTLQVVAGHPVVIARDGGGVYAMSTICTHEQCDMTSDGTIDAGGMYCSCHGSKFDVQGNVTKGPAGSPVRHFSVEIAAGGAITIHADVQVGVSTRVAVA